MHNMNIFNLNDLNPHFSAECFRVLLLQTIATMYLLSDVVRTGSRYGQMLAISTCCAGCKCI